MGNGCFKSTKHDANTNMLDLQLEQDRNADALNFKILLLGAGESGKSTISKQLVTIHKGKMLDAEKKNFISVLRGNLLNAFATFLKETRSFGHDDMFSEEEKELVKEVEATEFDWHNLTVEVAGNIQKLWETSALKATWALRKEFWHLDASEYYIENAFRFAKPDFMPTAEDTIFARKRTTGVVVQSFEYGGINWSVVDVGGQRSERRKWINCFDDVKAILFVANLSGYDKVLFEDKSVNRMHESIALFKKTLRNPVFAKTHVFLFLNKKDLFEDMLQNRPLANAFPEYKGPNTAAECIEFITELYQRELPEGKDKAHVHPIAARFKRDVKYAFEEVKDSLLKSSEKEIEKTMKNIQKLEKKVENEKEKQAAKEENEKGKEAAKEKEAAEKKETC